MRPETQLLIVLCAIPLCLYLGIRGLTWLLRHRRHRQVNRADPGCLACGSASVERVDAGLVCSDCGFVGRTDRGGPLGFDQAACGASDISTATVELLKREDR